MKCKKTTSEHTGQAAQGASLAHLAVIVVVNMSQTEHW